MIGSPAGTWVWLAAGVTDMRRSFDGLTAFVQTALDVNPFGGHVFVFRGKRGYLIKVLWWNGHGLCLFCKRLERGHLVWPQATADRRNCGGALQAIGEDVAEQLKFILATFRLIRRVWPKFGCIKCDTLVQAPAPSSPIERSIAGPGLLAHVLVDKYGNHMPLYPQSQMYERGGVELERLTLAE